MDAWRIRSEVSRELLIPCFSREELALTTLVFKVGWKWGVGAGEVRLCVRGEIEEINILCGREDGVCS